MSNVSKERLKELDVGIKVAIKNANFERLKGLIDKGGILRSNHFDFESWNLMVSSNKSEDVARYIVDNISDKNGLLSYVLKIGRKDLLQDIHSNGKGLHDWCLNDAIYSGSFDTVKYVVDVGIDIGVDVNARNSPDYSDLDYAICRGNVNIVKYLVEHGADVNHLVKGRDALDSAVLFGDVSMVEYLHKKGCDISNEKRKETIQVAIDFGKIEAIDYLVKNGVEFPKGKGVRLTKIKDKVLSLRDDKVTDKKIKI